jgi:pimeloyl-ACP methyl ester carboxylesterase
LGVVLILAVLSWGGRVGAVSIDRLDERYRALTLDGDFEASDAERLIDLALSDDLLISGPEAAFIAERVQRHGLAEVEVSADATGAEELGVRRARELMLQALRAGIGRTEYRRAMQQLVMLAMDPELTRAERFRILELSDRYRRVDPAVATRDAMEAIALLLTNPTEARLDREQRRMLERLEKQFQVPVILDTREPEAAGRKKR